MQPNSPPFRSYIHNRMHCVGPNVGDHGVLLSLVRLSAELTGVRSLSVSLSKLFAANN